jgi:glycosyltransferase involved in cell wall biosynthesis
VTSFRDNIYPESVLGTYVGKADEVICVSGYSADVIRYTAGRFFPDLLERIHQVNNGIDFEMFKPVDSSALASQLGVDPQEDVIVLHPHRPEPGKGLPETIRVIDQLVHRHGQTKVKALVPEWIDSMVSTDEASFYQQMTRLMDELGVRDHFVFVPWMPQETMPMLYSLGDVTLCLGNFVEAFGNVAYESLACGTPSIVARVGVHRTMMPDNLIDKVDFGDVDGAAERVMDILGGKANDQAEVLDYLRSTMDFHRQVSTYAEIITQCEKRELLMFSMPHYGEDQSYILAPWCYIAGERIYHDFHQGYEKDAVLIQLLHEREMISQAEATNRGVNAGQWQKWLENTWLVPVE